MPQQKRKINIETEPKKKLIYIFFGGKIALRFRQIVRKPDSTSSLARRRLFCARVNLCTVHLNNQSFCRVVLLSLLLMPHFDLFE